MDFGRGELEDVAGDARGRRRLFSNVCGTLLTAANSCSEKSRLCALVSVEGSREIVLVAGFLKSRVLYVHLLFFRAFTGWAQ